ncbi:ArsO family NAD(P)H-dependent flavin-containing monooxygenase [Deinococcus rubellus]|uniref:flavin-containing monooxygenase n=1 Tax=Deinococcus rubellus TaxID=1889240 RepID=UPI0031E6F0DF
MLDAVVIGGGAAGLSAAYWLQRRGPTFVVLEAERESQGAWPAYYDSLTLFTPARHSALPGLAFPGLPPRYPSRDEVAAYLRAYAAYFAFPVERGAQVVSVERGKATFTVTAQDGRNWTARTVVCASGTFRHPKVPELPGQSSFGGRLLHSSEYRHAQPFAGQRVVVVGAGNSGAQIAAELSQVARVTLASLRPPRFFPQRLLGLDLTDWLALSGLERWPLGRLGRVPDVQPVIAVPGLRLAFTRGNPDVRPMFRAFISGGLEWADGRREQVDSVIFATGYAWNGGYLPKAALDIMGEPRQRLGISTALPGLYFVGLPGQRTVASSTLRAAGPDARFVVGELAKTLGRPG